MTDPDRLLSKAEARGLRVSDRQVMLCGTRFNISKA